MNIKDIDAEQSAEIIRRVAGAIDSGADAIRQFGRAMHELAWAIEGLLKALDPEGEEE